MNASRMFAGKVKCLAAIPARALSLPGLAQIRRSSTVNAMLRRVHGSHWGRFASYDEALSFLPPSRLVSYDMPDIAQLNVETFSRIHLFDWPVLFFLQRAVDAGSTHVVDFGGHLGVKYFAFKEKIAVIRDLRWHVVDVPGICAEGGRRFADVRGNLSFHEDMATVGACDVLLCSGSLQYSKQSLLEILAYAPGRPKIIVLNKIGIVEREGFFTLESFGSGRMPYRVFTRADLSEMREALGYDRIGAWSIPDRSFSVHVPNGTERVAEIGEAWSVRSP